jgi:hypothetical protein
MFDKNVVIPILAAGAICKILLDNSDNSNPEYNKSNNSDNLNSTEDDKIDYRSKFDECMNAKEAQATPFKSMGRAFGSIGNITSNYFVSKLPKSGTGYAYLMFAIFILTVIIFIIISYVHDLDKTTSMAVLVILPIVFFGVLTVFVLQKQNPYEQNTYTPAINMG